MEKPFEEIMKKKILISLIICLAITSANANAKTSEPVNTISEDDVRKSIIAITEQNKNTDINTYGEPSIFDSDTLPNIHDYHDALNKNAKNKKQLQSAEKISKKLNGSIKNENSKEEVEKNFSGKIMNVDDCVKIALANHPTILSSLSSSEIYKSKIAQAWSAYFPQIGGGIEYSRNNMLVSVFAPEKQRYNMFYFPTANASILLFDFGKTKANVDVARKAYQASKDDVQRSINDVIFNVKKCYYDLLFAMQQEKVYQESVHDYIIHLEQAKAFYDIGTKPKIDVLTAEYNLGKAKLGLIKAQNNVKLAFSNLNNAIGIPEFTDYAIDENLETRTYSVLLDDMLKTAFETRPEYLAAQKKSEGSKILIKASKRAFLPDLKAYGNIQYGGDNIGNDVGYQVGASFAYSNFNALLLKKQVDEARHTAKKDLADLETVRQNVYLEVKQAYIELDNSKDSIPVAALAMMEAKEQYDLASGRYKVGLGDAVELKDAENTYRQAQLEYFLNLMNYNINAANLERVTGAPIQAEIKETEEQT